MVIGIHQPDYIPYLGYFYKISKSDRFIFLDDVQFSNNNMHHWNKIGGNQGEIRLKIPVEYHFKDFLNQVRTKDELGWKENHLKMIEQQYQQAQYYSLFYPMLVRLLSLDYNSLAHMNSTINQCICKGFGFTCELLLSSTYQIESKKEERVIDLCKELGGTVYYSGNGARAYQKEENFRLAKLELKYSDYRPKEYPQKWQPFIPNLSIIDYIFHCGFDWERMDYILR